MKKKTIDLLTTLVALVLFIFTLAAFWFEKMDGFMILIVTVLCVGLIAFKNDKLEAFIDKILNLKR